LKEWPENACFGGVRLRNGSKSAKIIFYAYHNQKLKPTFLPYTYPRSKQCAHPLPAKHSKAPAQREVNRPKKSVYTGKHMKGKYYTN